MYKYLILLFTTFLFSQNPSTDNNLLKLNLKELGKLYYEKDSIGKKVIADIYLQKAINLKDHYNIAIGYLYKSETSTEERDILMFLDKMINNSKKAYANSYILAFSYYRKGYYFCAKRKYKFALDNYILADKYLNKNENEKLYYTIQFDIALIKSSLLNYKESLPAFIEFHNYCEKTNDIDNLTAIYAIAESYNRLDNIKLSKHYTEYGKKLCLSLKDTNQYEKFILCEGMNLYKERKYLKAIKSLKNTLSKIKNDFANYSIASFYIGKSYLAINNQNKAIEYFKKVDSIFIKEDAIYIETINSYNKIINYYKKKNNIDKQLRYTNNLIKADSTLLSNYDYLTKKIHKDYDIPKLVKNKENLISKLSTEKVYYKITVVGFFTLLLIGISSFIKYRIKQKSIIIEQNKAFENYKKIQNQKYHSISSKKDAIVNDFSLIIQDELVTSILEKLKKFEEEKGYTSKDCTLDNLAKEFETNTTYLSKVINDKKGSNFSNYINGLRIDYAIYLLENDKQYRKFNMKGIADSLGFNNATSFSRAFIYRTNMRPSFFIQKLKTSSNL